MQQIGVLAMKMILFAGASALALAIVHRLIAVVDSSNAAIQRGEATQQVAFISEQVDGARRTLRSAEDSLAEFDVANRAVLSSPLLQQRRARLARSVTLAETFYTQMVAALQQAYVAAANNMSTISIIDAPALPGRRSWPKRTVIALVGFLLGVLASTARRYGRTVWTELRGVPR